jgi:hypothetical protein
MNIHTIGIDLGKTSFHLVGLNDLAKSSFANTSRVRSYCASPQTGKSIASACKPAVAPIFWAVRSNNKDTKYV